MTGATRSSEKRLSFATRDIGAFTQTMVIGFELAFLEPGMTLRIHLFEHTNSNGDERIASPYAIESTERALTETIERLRLPLVVRRDGLDLIVGAE